ncbi:protein kinase family protein [Pseudarthrobacter sp. AB1]|uniref:protein kinase family protein n=1 Tax=Pseudarthrobacter sp. AB1 TaxID=2138309 RepID=UPI00186B70C8|nr:protein kinase family protein [Pseudarthrobacter sp. AB1]MBE4717276.1 protein kinase family protein [Pseudarthrobacter sp. AB1]
MTSEFVYQDIESKYSERLFDDRYMRLYQAEDVHLRSAFAYLHDRLNDLLRYMNEKSVRGRHYNADQSRELIDVTRDIGQLKTTLLRIGVEVSLSPSYEKVLERCRTFLTSSGGSAIPGDFEEIPIEDYEPIFSVPTSTVRIEKSGRDYTLKSVGSGSYAQVYKYKDDEYRMHVAVKKARRTLDETEMKRFRAEFDVLADLSSPYVLSVFRYNEADKSYAMEYCDHTLGSFISENNGKSSFDFFKRKRIAQQFLYGISYLAVKGVLHRDLSFTNVLVKTYDAGVVQVKLSDFGLHKTQSSLLTRTGTEMKGTILDPTLDDFKNYSLANEIYAVGHVVSFIFTGRTGPHVRGENLGAIVRRCTDLNVDHRYKQLQEIINDVTNLRAENYLK